MYYNSHRDGETARYWFDKAAQEAQDIARFCGLLWAIRLYCVRHGAP